VQRHVAFVGDIIIDHLRINDPPVPQYNQPLVFEEVNIRQLWDGCLDRSGGVHQGFVRSSLEEMFFDEHRDLFLADALVEDPVRPMNDYRPPFAEALATGGHHKHFILQVAAPDFLFKSEFHLKRPVGNATGSRAHQQVCSESFHRYISYL